MTKFARNQVPQFPTFFSQALPPPSNFQKQKDIYTSNDLNSWSTFLLQVSAKNDVKFILGLFGWHWLQSYSQFIMGDSEKRKASSLFGLPSSRCMAIMTDNF